MWRQPKNKPKLLNTFNATPRLMYFLAKEEKERPLVLYKINFF